MVQKVKDATGNKISHVLDAVSGNDTQFTSIKVLAEDKPGKLTTVLPHAEGVQNVRKDVQIASSSPSLLSNTCSIRQLTHPLCDSGQHL
jgi:hypothetical protein